MYGYDKIQQLTSFKRGKEQGGAVTLPTRMQTFRYDALGNRISVEEDGKTTNYAVNNVNEYTEIRGELTFTPQYDANGNMVKDEAHTYRYDYNNKLVQVDENTATYTYDALGRRISKKTADGTVNFFYAGDDVIEEQDGSKALLATYLIGNGIDDMIKMNRKGNDYFYHTNHLGSVMVVSDRSGTVQERYEYDPFGKVSIYNGAGTQLVKSAIGNEVLFTGRSYNAESGLYDYRARAMKPNIGRFVQVDPLLYVDGMNALGYVNNNTVNMNDNLGLSSCENEKIPCTVKCAGIGFIRCYEECKVGGEVYEKEFIKIGPYAEILFGDSWYKNEDAYWKSYSLGSGLTASASLLKLAKLGKYAIPKNIPGLEEFLNLFEIGFSISGNESGVDWILNLGPYSKGPTTSSWGMSKGVSIGAYISIPINVRNKSQEFREAVEAQKTIENLNNMWL